MLLQSQLLLIISFVVAMVILLIQYSSHVLRVLFAGSEPNDYLVDQVLTQAIFEFLQLLSSLPYMNTVILGIIWILIAIIVYVSYLSLANALILVRNEVALDSQDYNRSKHYIIKHMGMKIFVLFVFFSFAIISFLWLFPMWNKYAGLSANTGFELSSLHYFILSWIGLSWNIFVLAFASKITFAFEKTL